MSSKVSLPKLVASVSIITFLSTIMYFSFYKAINRVIDDLAYEALDFLSVWGIDLSYEQFWFISGVILLFILVIIIFQSD